MNKLLFFFFFLSACATISQQPQKILIDESGIKHPWNHLSFNNNPDNFQFAVIADRTGGNRPNIYEDAVVKINLLQPEFVMSIGDNINGYTTDEAILDKQWKEFRQIITVFQMPFFYLAGNHDYINEVQAAQWEENFGRSYYHFIYKDVLFLCMNTEEAMLGPGKGGIEKPQFEYFRDVLRKNEKVKWTMIYMHQPLWENDSTRYWTDIEKILATRKHTVFAGHKHTFSRTQRNNGEYYVLATTGGGSQLRGPEKGEFDHILWITMTKDGPVIANILLNGIITAKP